MDFLNRGKHTNSKKNCRSAALRVVLLVYSGGFNIWTEKKFSNAQSCRMGAISFAREYIKAPLGPAFSPLPKDRREGLLKGIPKQSR